MVLKPLATLITGIALTYTPANTAEQEFKSPAQELVMELNSPQQYSLSDLIGPIEAVPDYMIQGVRK